MKIQAKTRKNEETKYLHFKKKWGYAPAWKEKFVGKA